mmetsp:Transcript_24110/g.75625  ORF Transcript_24110/g.75625 Transcript_24110/m.75625 type:complete len:222 (+) Transcript_24110:1674-2339(+)
MEQLTTIAEIPDAGLHQQVVQEEGRVFARGPGRSTVITQAVHQLPREAAGGKDQMRGRLCGEKDRGQLGKTPQLQQPQQALQELDGPLPPQEGRDGQGPRGEKRHSCTAEVARQGRHRQGNLWRMQEAPELCQQPLALWLGEGLAQLLRTRGQELGGGVGPSTAVGLGRIRRRLLSDVPHERPQGLRAAEPLDQLCAAAAELLHQAFLVQQLLDAAGRVPA